MKSPMFKVVFKWSGIAAGGFVLLSMFDYVFGINQSSFKMSILFQLIWFGWLILALTLSGLEYRKQHLGGFMKYGQALGLGLLIALFSSFVFSFFTFLFYEFVDPESFAKSIGTAIDSIQNNEHIPSEYKESTILQLIEQTPLKSAFQYFWSSNLFAFLFLLIIAIFTKKKNSSFEETFKDVM